MENGIELETPTTSDREVGPGAEQDDQNSGGGCCQNVKRAKGNRKEQHKNILICVNLKEKNQERRVVVQNLQEYEEDRTMRIKMAVSQRCAPIGPMACLLERLGVMTEWYTRKRPMRKEVLANKATCAQRWGLYGYPTTIMSLQNIFDTFIFNFTTWGWGDAEDAKHQLETEQSNVALVSALVLSISTAFLAQLVTPDGQGSTNFPSESEMTNYIIINCFVRLPRLSFRWPSGRFSHISATVFLV